MMPRSRALLSIPLLLLLFPVGCESDPTGPPAPIANLPRPLTAAEERVIQGSNEFALDLLREVTANEAESPNVFLSPLSASMALAMTMNGTAAGTWTQMRDVLGFDGLEEQEINESYRDLIALLLALDPGVTFGLGNSVWARQGIPFHASFYDRVTSYFGARVQELDFDDPGAKQVINTWVEDVTAGRITEMIESFPQGIIMYLINAVYFHGDWRQQFDEGATASQPFHRADGSTVTVPMMSVEGEFRTFATESALGVEMPYGGGAFTAVAVLPGGWGSTAADTVLDLHAATWRSWTGLLDEAEPTTVRVQLPRFELEYERTLNDDLEALGMPDAFSQVEADFTRLTPLDLPAGQGPPWVYISEVKQKTFVTVDEQGTEAAAATSVAIVLDSGPVTIRFDRPFLFAIRERISGTILFIGMIGDPS
jgi:serine protease inhibitor